MKNAGAEWARKEKHEEAGDGKEGEEDYKEIKGEYEAADEEMGKEEADAKDKAS